ncbi:MAG: phosphoenolpyruvate synthase [Thiobacillaceae bacterium]|nr:phosphoenolpyruvate synthase [Thiobacillaceae bacterium]MDW8322787.1 phosphoenolpyruvate synthase [Burkholderiales bacterium]
MDYILPLESLSMQDITRVGGKNASLGEMLRHLAAAGVRVPEGFATTAEAYREFLAQGGLDRRIAERLAGLEVADVSALSAAGRDIRGWILATPLPLGLEAAIRQAYARLCTQAGRELSCAVRSSATAEDLPQASFAGQQETFLNVRGADHLINAVRRCYASLYNDRAIAYRAHHGFDHAAVALSAGIQRMVRADLGVAGVMFTLDTESGFTDVVLINAAYGLGETVVQGAVNPDEYWVHKPTLARGFRPIVRRRLGEKAVRLVCADDTAMGQTTRREEVPATERARFCLSDDQVLELARLGMAIEAHYGRPMDIEWAHDGEDGRLYILQARPETVKSRAAAVLERYRLRERGRVLASGRAIGSRIGLGRARVIPTAAHMQALQPGEVLVTGMTDPDWEPVMKRAAAIVTDRGGRTCHAAIVARELGVPAVVGTGEATRTIPDGTEVTVSCAEGEEGKVYAGRLAFERVEIEPQAMPPLPVKIMLNLANPEQAFHHALLPNDGVGLARLEFIINAEIGIHPCAALDYARLPEELQAAIRERSLGYADPVAFYVGKLAEGIATIAAAFWPKPVIVRLSDFKSNEYAHLIGGERYEPQEENPMLGFRGAGRYVHPRFRPAFDLECRAIRRVREEMGLANVEVMLPFVRTLAEADAVLAALAENGLRRGQQGLRLIMMCEIPSNVLSAADFLQRFDGFSIGSNDLTQLTLGVDRDSELVAASFDERDPAVKRLLAMAIEACRQAGKTIGICGQAPSDHPDLAAWLARAGITSLSLNPDTVLDTWLTLAQALHEPASPREAG